jgi:hypothetical protein
MFGIPYVHIALWVFGIILFRTGQEYVNFVPKLNKKSKREFINKEIQQSLHHYILYIYGGYDGVFSFNKSKLARFVDEFASNHSYIKVIYQFVDDPALTKEFKYGSYSNTFTRFLNTIHLITNLTIVITIISSLLYCINYYGNNLCDENKSINKCLYSSLFELNTCNWNQNKNTCDLNMNIFDELSVSFLIIIISAILGEPIILIFKYLFESLHIPLSENITTLYKSKTLQTRDNVKQKIINNKICEMNNKITLLNSNKDKNNSSSLSIGFITKQISIEFSPKTNEIISKISRGDILRLLLGLEIKLTCYRHEISDLQLRLSFDRQWGICKDNSSEEELDNEGYPVENIKFESKIKKSSCFNKFNTVSDIELNVSQACSEVNKIINLTNKRITRKIITNYDETTLRGVQILQIFSQDLLLYSAGKDVLNLFKNKIRSKFKDDNLNIKSRWSKIERIIIWIIIILFNIINVILSNYLIYENKNLINSFYLYSAFHLCMDAVIYQSVICIFVDYFIPNMAFQYVMNSYHLLCSISDNYINNNDNDNQFQNYVELNNNKVVELEEFFERKTDENITIDDYNNNSNNRKNGDDSTSISNHVDENINNNSYDDSMSASEYLFASHYLANIYPSFESDIVMSYNSPWPHAKVNYSYQDIVNLKKNHSNKKSFLDYLDVMSAKSSYFRRIFFKIGSYSNNIQKLMFNILNLSIVLIVSIHIFYYYSPTNIYIILASLSIYPLYLIVLLYLTGVHRDLYKRIVLNLFKDIQNNNNNNNSDEVVTINFEEAEFFNINYHQITDFKLIPSFGIKKNSKLLIKCINNMTSDEIDAVWKYKRYLNKINFEKQIKNDVALKMEDIKKESISLNQMLSNKVSPIPSVINDNDNNSIEEKDVEQVINKSIPAYFQADVVKDNKIVSISKLMENLEVSDMTRELNLKYNKQKAKDILVKRMILKKAKHVNSSNNSDKVDPIKNDTIKEDINSEEDNKKEIIDTNKGVIYTPQRSTAFYKFEEDEDSEGDNDDKFEDEILSPIIKKDKIEQKDSIQEPSNLRRKSVNFNQKQKTDFYEFSSSSDEEAVNVIQYQDDDEEYQEYADEDGEYQDEINDASSSDNEDEDFILNAVANIKNKKL